MRPSRTSSRASIGRISESVSPHSAACSILDCAVSSVHSGSEDSGRMVANPEVIQPRTRRFPAMTLVRCQRIWQLRPKKACYFGRPYPLT
jgi:hypothetical protein